MIAYITKFIRDQREYGRQLRLIGAEERAALAEARERLYLQLGDECDRIARIYETTNPERLLSVHAQVLGLNELLAGRGPVLQKVLAAREVRRRVEEVAG